MFLADIDTRKKHNNLTLIRTLAALAVTFGHSYILFTGTSVNLWLDVNSGYFGFMAVAIFFGLSGYLVTQSFSHSKSWGTYLEARVLRIFPGLLFANLVSILMVFLFRDIAWTPAFLLDAGAYIARTFILDNGCLTNVFTKNPVNCVNGSLWTLGFEFRYYLFVMAFGLFGFYRRRWKFLALVVVLSALAYFLPHETASSFFSKTIRVHSRDSTFLSLVVSFVMGMLFYLYREKVYLSPAVALVGFVIAFFSEVWFVRVVFAIYGCFVIGFHPKLYVKAFPQKFDISYGIYILSFPVQQTLIASGSVDSPMALFLLTTLIVIPFALVSWKLVEEPALRWKGVFAKRASFKS